MYTSKYEFSKTSLRIENITDNTLHFCEFCNTSGTLQRLPSGSVTDPIPYRDYPYPTEPILYIWKISYTWYE